MTKDIGKGIGKVLFYILAFMVILWTGSLTYGLVSRLLPGNWITPLFALALFDGGALVWLLVFLKSAAGIPQRVISIMAFGLDLMGVVFVSMSELFLGGQELAAIPQGLGTYVVWGIGGFTAINLIAIYTFHIANPEEITEIRVRSLQDKVQDEALRQVEAQITEMTPDLAVEIKRRMFVDVLSRLSLPIPGNTGNVIDGEPAEMRTFESETASTGNAEVQQNPTPARTKHS